MTHTDTTCPFCGILCTDVTVQTDGKKIIADTNLPAACQTRYARANYDGDPTPQIAGKTATLDEAVRRAAQILASAEHPLFSGLGCDVNAMRVFVRLARRHHATMDHMQSHQAMGGIGMIQNQGWVGGTMSEAAARADLFVILGNQTLDANPRFAERVIRKRHRANQATRIVIIGDTIPEDIKDLSPELIQIPKEMYARAIRYLNMLTQQAPIPPEAEAQFPAATELQSLHQRLFASRYSCIVWKTDLLSDCHTDIATTSISRLVKSLNKTTRAIGIMTGNNAGENTFSYVSLWQAGTTMRSSFSSGDTTEYAPLIHHTDNLLARDKIDVLLQVAPLTSPTSPTKTAAAIKTIFIGHPGTSLETAPEVYIPTGIPGIDHAGHLFRVDSIAVMRLNKVRDVALPSAAEALTQIERLSSADK